VQLFYDEYCQNLRGNGKGQLEEFVKNYTHNDEVQPELVVDQGIAPDAILSFAQEEKSELIVMGTYGLRGFDRLMLGSVTDRVMRKAICPVMAVREPPHYLAAAGQERRYIHRRFLLRSTIDKFLFSPTILKST
jgi:universal stress protein family protein